MQDVTSLTVYNVEHHPISHPSCFDLPFSFLLRLLMLSFSLSL